MANTRNTPIEETEMRAPMLCERYELRSHQPAAGAWRGGIGSVRRWRFLTPTIVGANGDSRSDRPRGLFGGHDGVSGRIVYNSGRPSESVLPSRFSAFRADAGDTLDIEVPSGAGYGSPLDRSPAAVLADLLDGLIDEEAAVAIYGVVMTSDVLDIDLAATVAARRAIAASQES